MGNIVTAKVKIKGIRPLMWHKFGPDALPLEKQEKTGVAGHDPEEWRRTCLITRDGQLFLRPDYIFGAIRDGAKYTKRGRGSIQKHVVATLQVVDARVLIDRWFPGFPNGNKFDVKVVNPPSEDSDEPTYLDIRGVRNPTTRARNVRYRITASPGLSTEFTLTWDKTIVSRGEMEAVAIDTGKLVGIGSGRAIGMGRFEIESFEVLE